MIELWFYVPLDTKLVISETFHQVNLLALYGMETNVNLIQQKHAFTNEKKLFFVSDIAIFVLKRDVKLQLTN